jgi:D-aminopeptidase
MVLGVPCPPPEVAEAGERGRASADRRGTEPTQRAGNSCVIVLVTDARLDSRQLTRLAARAFGGMARTGSDFSGHSGDYALAVSTAGPGVGGGQGTAADGGGPVPDRDLDLLFLAAIEATEEAILNSLFMAVTTTGVGGHTRQAVPLDYVTARVAAARS